MDRSKGGASENMRADAAMLDLCATLQTCVLRFYSWNDPLPYTCGISQKPDEVAKMLPSGATLAVRPSGGGVVCHANDITYAFAAPRGHALCEMAASASYALVHRRIAETLSMHLNMEAYLCAQSKPCKGRIYACFSTPACGDVECAGLGKIAGAAQKRNRLGMLFQGSVDYEKLKSFSPKPVLTDILESALKSFLDSFGF